MSAWRVALEGSKRRTIVRMRQMAPRGDRIVMRYIWRLWIEFIEVEQFEREVRNRTAATWHKVQGWIQEKDSS